MDEAGLDAPAAGRSWDSTATGWWRSAPIRISVFMAQLRLAMAREPGTFEEF